MLTHRFGYLPSGGDENDKVWSDTFETVSRNTTRRTVTIDRIRLIGPGCSGADVLAICGTNLACRIASDLSARQTQKRRSSDQVQLVASAYEAQQVAL